MLRGGSDGRGQPDVAGLARPAQPSRLILLRSAITL